MKSKKFSLKKIDDETAELLDKEYPTELTPDDVDDIFKKSYKKFLQADSVKKNNSETIVESAPVEVIQPKHKFSFLTFNKVCAALFGIIAVTAFYAMLRMPDNDIETPEDINKIPLVTGKNSDTSSVPSVSATTTESNKKTTYSSTTTITTSTQISTFSENIVTESFASNTEYVEETTEIQHEETEFQTETTEITTETTEITTTTTFQTTTEPVTTDRKDNPWGYFNIQEFEGASYMNVKYERTNTEPVTMLEHAMNVDYYSCEILAEYPGANMVWELKTAEENPPILFQEFAYEYFLRQLNVQAEITFTEINGRPAILSYSQGSYGLAWDDGCHVCSIHAYEPDYDFMFEFAENYK